MSNSTECRVVNMAELNITLNLLGENLSFQFLMGTNPYWHIFFLYPHMLQL